MGKIFNKYKAVAAMLLFSIMLAGCGTTKPSEETSTSKNEKTKATETELALNTETESATNTEAEVESESEDAAENQSTENNTATSSAQEEIPGYTFTDLSQTMYATTSVNVRNLPSADGDKLGALYYNQEVIVTGKCNETGWYRIEYNSGNAYVSDSYVSDTKQAERSSAPIFIGGNTFTQTQEAYFDRDKGVAVFNMINAERAANGLAQLAWDENAYNWACRRAQEIVTDFSHSGNAGSPYGENIYWGSGVRSADEIHTAYYNSPGHHENYMTSYYAGGAVAVYVYNGITYCSENFTVANASSGNNASSAVNDIYVVEHWTASNGVTIDVMSNGNLQGSYSDLDMVLAAMDEYFACH